jgi:hypothetical protein
LVTKDPAVGEKIISTFALTFSQVESILEESQFYTKKTIDQTLEKIGFSATSVATTTLNSSGTWQKVTKAKVTTASSTAGYRTRGILSKVALLLLDKNLKRILDIEQEAVDAFDLDIDLGFKDSFELDGKSNDFLWETKTTVIKTGNSREQSVEKRTDSFSKPASKNLSVNMRKKDDDSHRKTSDGATTMTNGDKTRSKDDQTRNKKLNGKEEKVNDAKTDGRKKEEKKKAAEAKETEKR